MGKTLFDKVWDSHVVKSISQGPDQLYIDRHYCHEVTSPQAFDALRKRGLKVFRPEKTFCAPDHNIPTKDQHLPIKDETSRVPVETLTKNAKEFGLTLFPLCDPRNGIIHVIGPEQGLTLPGMTIVCGDSHTSTHGALGAIAFGIGTSEIEMVLATQCVLQPKPKSMRISIEGKLGKGVTAKDIALYLISKLGTGGATGYFVEYAGEAVRNLNMEERMTLCNLSIEMGARGGMIAPDETTFEYVKNRHYAPKGEEWEKYLQYWKTLPTDPDAKFDKELQFAAEDIEPRVTFGTNPGMGIGISETIPAKPESAAAAASYLKALDYMGFKEAQKLEGTPVDYVFLGSCTNGRIQDFRDFASIVKGKKKSDKVIVWLVPGSQQVKGQIEEEGLDKIIEEAGFEIREPGCSACLAMNEDKVPSGKLCVSTSNRNFEGRQGPGARTVLAGPLVAAAAAITGEITDPRKFL
ncbi:MAG: 3-isopropylmalate dehydratase large subunit [Muribaculaceae bacterium]|nr:3-isopropylmalate dehydratase large subunit [Muribaculaceae bacterium]